MENIQTFTDSNLRLNGFRLLRGLCEQHSQEFLSLADQVFACVKVSRFPLCGVVSAINSVRLYLLHMM